MSRLLRMGVLLLVGALGLGAGSPGAGPAPGEALTAVAARAVAATVMLDVEQGEGVTPGLLALREAYGVENTVGESTASSIGSGVVVRPTGLVLTNHHVVRSAKGISAVLSDGRRFPAHLVGSDPRTDVAVVQIDAPGPFPWAPMGDSDTLAVGTWVLTVGHPFSFPWTVTAGILSAKHRRGLSPDDIEDYLQTDAAVNPGGSGGPLFDLRGEVVGINTAVYTSAQAGSPPPAGLSFAIPIRLAWRVSEALLAGKPIPRPWIGLEVKEPAAEIAQIAPGGPAAEAGLAVGDRIVQVDDEVVADADSLASLIASKAPGQRLAIRVQRGQDTREVALTVGDTNGQLGEPTGAAAPTWAGLSLGTPADDGCPVLAVSPESPAARAGLRAGDRLLAVLGQTVDSRDAWRDAAKGRKTAVVKIWRDGQELFAVLAIAQD